MLNWPRKWRVKQMDKCTWCESVYESKESTASENVKTAVCSSECEQYYKEFVNKPIEFIE